MSLRGETVGTAFVRILADGRDLPDSIKEEMDRAGPVVEASGQKHSKQYDEAFAAEMKKAGPGKLDQALTESIARSNAIEDYFTGPRWQKIVRRLDKQFSEDGNGLGLTIADNIQRGIREAGDLGVLHTRLGNINKEILVANRQIIRAMDDEQAALRRATQAAVDTETHMRGVVDEWRKMEAAAKDGGKEIVRTDGRLTRFLRTNERFAAKIKKDGALIAKGFGKDSRNNAINFFGSLVGGMVDSLQVFPRFANGAANAFTKSKQFVDLFKVGFGAAGGGSFLNGVIGGLKEAGPALGGIAKSGPAAVAAIAALLAILGTAVAVLSGVAAAATALASALGFALVGAVAPLLGLLAPLVATVGVLGIAFAGMGKKARTALAKDLKPITKELNILRVTAQKGLFGNIGKDAKDIAPAIRVLKPLVHDVAVSLGGVFDGFAKAGNSKGFKAFIADMDKFLPRAITLLGKITGQTIGGIGGVFRALEPITLRFLGAVDNISSRFSRFTNSAKGQSSLKDFFKEAGDRAVDVLNLLKSIGGLIATIANPGEKSGGNIITSLTDNVEKFTKFLKANPDALKDWFKNGEKVISEIGQIVVDIGRILDALDSPENRTQAQTFLHLIELTMHAVGIALLATQAFVTPLVTAFKLLAITANAIKGPMVTAFRFIELAFLDIVGGIVHAAAVAFGWVPGIGKKLKDADRKVHDWAESVKLSIQGIPKSFTISGHLKMQVDTINAAHLSNQAKAKLIEIAFNNAKALGGPVFSGQPYLVGERGPELFVPEQSGKIVPNNDPAVQQMLRGKGSPSVTNNRNRSIDASGWTIVTPTDDPRAVASEVVNKLVAVSI